MSASDDRHKIDELWNRLDAQNKENASLKFALKLSEASLAKQQDRIKAQDATIESLMEEIRRLGIEVNAARDAALTAVHDYIAFMEA